MAETGSGPSAAGLETHQHFCGGPNHKMVLLLKLHADLIIKDHVHHKIGTISTFMNHKAGRAVPLRAG